MVNDNFLDLSLWVKFPNLSFYCRNDKSFSKIANKIGILLAMDSLMASKSRIMFARFSIQISPSSPLPNSISMNLNGIM